MCWSALVSVASVASLSSASINIQFQYLLSCVSQKNLTIFFSDSCIFPLHLSLAVQELERRAADKRTKQRDRVRKIFNTLPDATMMVRDAILLLIIACCVMPRTTTMQTMQTIDR
jgi:hypothetical protein